MKTQEEVGIEPSKQDPEVKRSVTMATVAAPEVPFADRMEYFSDWFRAKKSVALCLHYLRKLKRSHEEKRLSDNESLLSHRKEANGASYAPITVEELRSAEVVILRAAQAASFKEIDHLSKRQRLPDDKYKAIPESKYTSNL